MFSRLLSSLFCSSHPTPHPRQSSYRRSSSNYSRLPFEIIGCSFSERVAAQLVLRVRRANDLFPSPFSTLPCAAQTALLLPHRVPSRGSLSDVTVSFFPRRPPVSFFNSLGLGCLRPSSCPSRRAQLVLHVYATHRALIFLPLRVSRLSRFPTPSLLFSIPRLFSASKPLSLR